MFAFIKYRINFQSYGIQLIDEVLVMGVAWDYNVNSLTVNIIDLEEKTKFVDFGTIGQQGESIHQLPQTDVAATVFVEQLEKPFRKE